MSTTDNERSLAAQLTKHENAVYVGWRVSQMEKLRALRDGAEAALATLEGETRAGTLGWSAGGDLPAFAAHIGRLDARRATLADLALDRESGLERGADLADKVAS